MKKYLLLTVIVIIVVGGLLTLFWFFPGILPFGQNKNESANSGNLTDNVNLDQVANTNQEAINLNLSLQTGTIEINKAVTYKEVEFNILSADKLNTFENQTAGEGKTLVVLYLQRISSRQLTEIFSWLRNEVKIKNNQAKEYALKSLNLAGESAPDYAASYLIFETGAADKGFSLNFGTANDLKTIDLGF
ncbi:MAG: hypothetical protein ABIH38_04745 [Patescibacteria group bacterium]